MAVPLLLDQESKVSMFISAKSLVATVLMLACCGMAAAAQPPGSSSGGPSPATAPQSASLPPDYVIGTDDVLGVLFWRDETMSADVLVRPDGRISLPLLNDIDVAGQTPDQLRTRLMELTKQFVAEPNVTVIVRQINSRKVFITGQVTRPGPYPLTAPTTVLQLLALAGGLTDYANGKEIAIIRTGTPQSLRFNYEDVRKGKNAQQNIELKVGDTVIVP